MAERVEPLVTFVDHPTRDDFRVFLERIVKTGEPEVRMVTRGTTLAVYGCTQKPQAIMDRTPVVLVMRTFELKLPTEELPGQYSAGAGAGATTGGSELDVTVTARALLDRVARLGPLGRGLNVPDTVIAAGWAGVLPPTAGWQKVAPVRVDSLREVAATGAQRIATALPDQPGEALVRTVRQQVWGAEILPGIPGAAAFAAESMGFLVGEQTALIAVTNSWNRISTQNGHVVVRRVMS